ncbi:MAG TPA: hypothetical protein VII10_03725, partial [Reyranella sp.]
MASVLALQVHSDRCSEVVFCCELSSARWYPVADGSWNVEMRMKKALLAAAALVALPVVAQAQAPSPGV